MQRARSVYAVQSQNNELVVKQYIVTINIYIYFLALLPTLHDLG